MKEYIKLKFYTQIILTQIILTQIVLTQTILTSIMSQQQTNPDVELNQYSEDMTAYTLEQLVQWRASLERKAKEQEEKARAAKASQSNKTNSRS
ncbi:hypothetical protein CY34DRAFT_11750 [Suillus luteus UH-Slu-Lm8-n1]|uniref:Uncharacterized protein n=1 Tax=Suillus luteus UH-Slu-Lm8-n1 TaxID=930992 RepID=A0A0D0ANN6_9AGAM|nr:hypothetical protein CY34DRAFT_11750 [Suillus luteus UH-Slu-Lm8-n1]